MNTPHPPGNVPTPRDILGERPLGSQRVRLARCGAAIVLVACASGCTALRTAVHNFADLDDHKIFANRSITAGNAVSPLHALQATPGFLARLQVANESGDAMSVESYLAETRTAAFLVVHEDRVLYERYARGYDAQSLLNSFSIAKAVVATLLGMALAEGRLGSLDDPVAAYRPELASSAYGRVPIRQLVTMTSGLGDRPSLLPGRSQFYYGDDLHAVIAGARPEPRPANGWRYSEGDIEVLGRVLAASVGRSLSDYASEKLWRPLGMESGALWALDREGGTEKAFCCISARARDFARLGRLWVDAGRWQGEELVPAQWMRAGVPGVRTPDGYTHRNLWWVPEGGEGDFYAYGHNGQYLYVNPAARVVIVKFSETAAQDPVPLFRAIARSLREPTNLAEVRRLANPSFASR